MLTTYSQESSLEQAIRETFGGDRPCELCKIIDQSKQDSPDNMPANNQSESRDLKLMLGLGRPLSIEANVLQTKHPTIYSKQALEGHSSDRTPPPRVFA